MTAPLLGEKASFASETSAAWAGPRRVREAKPVSLFWERVKRGAHRQIGVLALVFALAIGVGLLYEFAAGVPALEALPACLAIAVVVAFAIGVASELGRNTVTSVAGLRKHLNYLVLGAAPELTPEAFRELPPDQRTPLGCLTFQPGSAFATSFRNLQGTISSNRMIAVIGSIPNEGASTSALGIAVSATQQGRSVLLVDCDLRRRSLTRALIGDADAGILEAADRPNNWRGLIHQEAETGLHFLPAAKSKNPWNTIVGMAGLPLLLEDMRKTYDLIVLDCPPALGSADGATLAHLADGCIVVAAWDDTPMGALKESMRALRARTQAGVYVNRVPPGYRFGRLRPE